MRAILSLLTIMNFQILTLLCLNINWRLTTVWINGNFLFFRREK